MHRSVLASCFVVSMAGALVRAQIGPPPIDIIGVEPLEFGEIVTGVPFIAEATSEMTQEFADGNRIERRSTSSIARDSLGRVRREQALPQFGPFSVELELRLVTISDPRSKTVHTLDPVKRTVSTFPMPPGPLGRPGEPGGPSRSGRPPMPPPPPMTVDNIGTRQIAGVKAEGTRQTMTIPAGVFGNVRPIDIVTERWFAPELKVVVESRRTDPRMGDVLYRIVRLSRVEPSRDLFEIPSDYKVVERPRFGPRPR